MLVYQTACWSETISPCCCWCRLQTMARVRMRPSWWSNSLNTHTSRAVRWDGLTHADENVPLQQPIRTILSVFTLQGENRLVCVQRKENQTVVVTCDLGNPMKHRQKVSESPIPLKQRWVSFILKVARFQTSDSNHKIIYQVWLSRKTSKRCRSSDLEVWIC